MTRHRPSLPALLLGAVAALGIAACGPKRPPVSATDPGRTTPDRGTPVPTIPVEPVDEGPDVTPIEGEGVEGTDIPFDSAEGGPLADIRFDFDQATLSDEARSTLERHALWLQNNRGVRVRIEGHCDERGTVDYNVALGQARAQAARDYLVSLGVDPGRLTTVSYGKEKPLDAGHTEEAWARNRRGHFALAR